LLHFWEKWKSNFSFAPLLGKVEEQFQFCSTFGKSGKVISVLLHFWEKWKSNFSFAPLLGKVD